MNDRPLEAHSPQEALLYVMICPCAVCGRSTVSPEAPSTSTVGNLLRIIGVCGNCGSSHEYRFAECGGDVSDDPLAQNSPINPTENPSLIIDVVQWVSLYAYFADAASRTPDPQESRWRMIRAGECLDEALRFYDDGQLPDESVAFAIGSRELLRKHPSRYRRDHLAGLRQKCPVARG